MEVINNTGLKLAVLPIDGMDGAAAALLLIKGTFKLVPGGCCTPLPETDQREATGDAAHKDALGRSPSWVTDFAPFKPHTDCFVLGTAYAPGGAAVPGFRAGFQVGPLVKTVQLWGPRWLLPSQAVSAPTPVASVPLRWELSAGGIDNPANPYGLGEEAGPDGAIALPQIEGAAEPGLASGGPANLAPVPAWFAERAGKRGTFDRRWQLFRAPDPPLDADPTYHNAAPFDQQAGNFPKGSEKLTLVNLHAKVPTLEATLPGLRPRVVVVRCNDDAAEVAMRLDTIILLPDLDQLVLLWRGQVATADKGMSDIALVNAGIEPLEKPVAAAALVAAARTEAAARKPKDNTAAIAQLELDNAKEVQKILKDVDLPAPLRAVVNTEKNPSKLFDALLGHLDAELKRVGH